MKDIMIGASLLGALWIGWKLVWIITFAIL